MKYIAIKVRGMDHWLWFKREMANISNGQFVGKEGWGKDGSLTEIKVSESLIEGLIDSETLDFGSSL